MCFAVIWKRRRANVPNKDGEHGQWGWACFQFCQSDPVNQLNWFDFKQTSTGFGVTKIITKVLWNWFLSITVSFFVTTTYDQSVKMVLLHKILYNNTVFTVKTMLESDWCSFLKANSCIYSWVLKEILLKFNSQYSILNIITIIIDNNLLNMLI